jgi:dephospho-CoA kinase
MDSAYLSAMKVIGLTGGIGSGKSFVAQILQKMGYPVFFSDSESKLLTDKHPEIRKGLMDLVGEKVYDGDELNRKFLADCIFSNPDLRGKVNALIHPIVRQHFLDWTKVQKSNLVFNEAAILFETGAYRSFSAVWLVVAPLELRIERVRFREKCDRKSVEQRISAQLPDTEKMKLTPFVLYNDEQQPLLCQIEKLLNDLNA